MMIFIPNRTLLVRFGEFPTAMVRISARRSQDRQRFCSWARTHDSYNELERHGGHTHILQLIGRTGHTALVCSVRL